MSSRGETCLHTQLPCAMNHKVQVARFLRAQRNGYTGVSPILPLSLALSRNDFKGRVKFGTISRRKSKPGVTKCVLSKRRVMQRTPIESSSSIVREEVRRRYSASASG